MFVLCDEKFDRLSKAERVALLHEGHGSRVDRAYVELEFDNSDNRLPYEMDTVSLRRQIGTDKDMFFINKVHRTKREVVNMLESAGFSRSNPYYIVQQGMYMFSPFFIFYRSSNSFKFQYFPFYNNLLTGKVKALAVMSAAERLNLLKDVAGCKVYETRRKESMKLYSQAGKNQDHVTTTHTQIAARLKQLQEEKEELSQYQELDKTRRALEYCLNEKDMRYAKDALEKLEALRNQEVTISEEIHDNLTTTTTSKRELNVTITKLENDIVYLKDEEKEQKILIQKLRTNVASINLEVTDTNNRLKDIAKLNEDMGTEKENLIIAIAELKNKLNSENGLKYIYENDSNELEQTKQQIDIRDLRDMQDRALRFATEHLRDTFLTKHKSTESQQTIAIRKSAKIENQEKECTPCLMLNKCEGALKIEK